MRGAQRSILLSLSSLAIVDTDGFPKDFRLDQNFPNPFNASTSIPFSVDRTTHVSLTIHDLNGRLVATIADRTFEAGNYVVSWEARDLASGLYLYTIKAGNFNSTRKMIILR